MASYNVVTVDLSVAKEREAIAGANVAISSVMVLSLTDGIGPLLHIGDGPGIPIFAGFTADVCPPEVAGLFITIAEPAAGELVLLLSYGGLSAGSV